MKLTQLLPIVLAIVTIGWVGKATASQAKEPSSIKIIVKAPAEELKLSCPLNENPELGRHIAAVFNKKYEEKDWRICRVAAHLLKVEYEKILDCFRQHTVLEIDTLTKTQREALQLLNAVVKKDENTTYREHSIEAYENLYLAFRSSSNFATFDDLFLPIQRGLSQHYKDRFFENNVFYFEKFAQYLKENYTPQDADVLAEFFVRKLQHRQKVFSFGGSREALAKCGPHLSRLSNFGIFEQESKAALEKEQQAAVQEAENLKKQAVEKKAAPAQQGPAPKMAHDDHAPLDESKPAATVEPAQGQQKPEDALDILDTTPGFHYPDPVVAQSGNVFAKTERYFRAHRWAKYTVYVLMGLVVSAAAVYGFGKYRNARKLVRSAGRWV